MKIYGYRSKTPWKMGLATFVYGLILMIIVIAIIDPSSEKIPTDSKQVVDTANMNMTDYAQYLVEETAGEKTNKDKPFFRQVIDTESYLTIDLNSNDNLTTNLFKTSLLVDSIDIYKKAFTDRPDLNGLKLVWYTNLVDVKGNESEGAVMWMLFSKENAATVNWENVISDNLPKIADDYWEHPLFSRK